MTADWSHLPYDLLARISTRIINEVNGREPRGVRHQLASRRRRSSGSRDVGGTRAAIVPEPQSASRQMETRQTVPAEPTPSAPAQLRGAARAARRDRPRAGRGRPRPERGAGAVRGGRQAAAAVLRAAASGPNGGSSCSAASTPRATRSRSPSTTRPSLDEQAEPRQPPSQPAATRCRDARRSGNGVTSPTASEGASRRPSRRPSTAGMPTTAGRRLGYRNRSQRGRCQC